MKLLHIRAALIALLIFVTGVWVGGLLPARWNSQASSPGHHADSEMAAWTHPSEDQLALAELFILARNHGVGAAMDSLRARGSRVAMFQQMSPTMLHHVAHSLGRFAEEQSGFDPKVMLECRVGYAAGCYHGVMEGYFSSQPLLDSASLANLCEKVAPRVPDLAERECAHGMGHGLMELSEATLGSALASCDQLTAQALQRECYDGVFMTTVTSPGAGEMHGMPGMTMAGSHMHAATGAGGDNGCQRLPERYLASCWAYRPLKLIVDADGDLNAAIRVCDTVVVPARGDCYYGVGKQGAGLYPDESARVAESCRSGDPRYAANCRTGMVAYYTDVDWTADRAARVCSSLPGSEKPDCYRSLGRDMKLMQSDRAAVVSECQKSEKDFVSGCIAGAGAGA